MTSDHVNVSVDGNCNNHAHLGVVESVVISRRGAPNPVAESILPLVGVSLSNNEVLENVSALELTIEVLCLQYGR